MKESNGEKLSVQELETLKSFTQEWIKVYCVMPPEQVLSIILVLHRIAHALNERVKQVATINIVQAPTLDQYAINIQQIQRNSMMNRY